MTDVPNSEFHTDINGSFKKNLIQRHFCINAFHFVLCSQRYNPFIDGQPYMEGVVAKKSPGLSGLPAM